MFKIVITSSAKATLMTLVNQAPASYAEMHLTLTAASRVLAPITLIGVVNHTHDVHFLEPAGSGKPMLVLTDCTASPDRLWLVDFPEFSSASALSNAEKRMLTERAANQVNIFATDVYIP